MININSGFNVTGPPIDDRFVLTKEEMKSMPDSRMPDVYVALCEDDNNLYTYKKDNDTDPDTGKYKLYAVLDKKPKIYGFHIDGTESDSFKAITYLSDCDNANYTPAGMNFETGTFSYGSWNENEFFMPRPCMLKNDGTVDYYLDPNDYGKKADGTASDVEDEFYEGNAMMEWGRNGNQIWTKVVPDSSNPSTVDIYISDTQIDDDYHAYSFIGTDGVTLKEHFYTAIYGGLRTTSTNKLRSYSSHSAPTCYVSHLEFVNSAKRNGAGWNIETFGDRCLISYLLMLMGKCIAPKKVFGYGNRSTGGPSANGELDRKGLFWGRNSSTISDYIKGVKVFGMENYWGSVWRRTLGLLNDNGQVEYKMCYGTSDGSRSLNYDFTDESDLGAGFISTGKSTDGETAYIDGPQYTSGGAWLPMKARATATESYYGSYLWSCVPKFICVAAFGGQWADNEKAGLFSTSICTAWNSTSQERYGACLTYR